MSDRIKKLAPGYVKPDLLGPDHRSAIAGARRAASFFAPRHNLASALLFFLTTAGTRAAAIRARQRRWASEREFQQTGDNTMFSKNLARQIKYAAFGFAAIVVTLCGASQALANTYCAGKVWDARRADRRRAGAYGLDRSLHFPRRRVERGQPPLLLPGRWRSRCLAHPRQRR